MFGSAEGSVKAVKEASGSPRLWRNSSWQKHLAVLQKIYTALAIPTEDRHNPCQYGPPLCVVVNLVA